MNNPHYPTLLSSPRPQQALKTTPEMPWAWRPIPSPIATLAGGFAPISLQQMDSVALLNRIDTKFVLTVAQLRGALAALQADYSMLSIQGQRLNHYRTLYFDTPGFDLYHLHVNERAERYKVRSREYTDTHLSFLEVKHKTRKDRTVKERIATSQPAMEISPEMNHWLQGVCPLDGNTLEPKLWNTFTRLTLVSKQQCERLTLDLNLAFYTTDKMMFLEGLAIAEVKVDASHRCSPFLEQMHLHRIHPRGFSKYCLGVSLLYDQVKKNALKPKLLWIEKTLKGTVQ